MLRRNKRLDWEKKPGVAPAIRVSRGELLNYAKITMPTLLAGLLGAERLNKELLFECLLDVELH